MAASTPNHEPPAVRAISPNANLAKLAAEIHIEIAEMLEDKELRVLRQVCRALAKDTTDVFAKRFFSMMNVSLDIESLLKFVEKTKVSYLAKWMKRIKLQPGNSGFKDGNNSVPSYVQMTVALAVPLEQSFRNLSLLGAGKTILASRTSPGFDLNIIGRALADSGHEIDVLTFDMEDWRLVFAEVQRLGVERTQVLLQTWTKLRVLRIRLPWFGTFNMDKCQDLRCLFLGANQITSLHLDLSDLEHPEALQSIHTSMRLEHIRRLRVGRFSMEAWEIMNFLLKVRSSLKELMLVDGQIDGGMENWPLVLNRMADELHLTSFLGIALEGHYGDYGRRSFCDRDGDSRFSCEGSEEDVRAKIKEWVETGSNRITDYGQGADYTRIHYAISMYEYEVESTDEDWWYRHGRLDASIVLRTGDRRCFS